MVPQLHLFLGVRAGSMALAKLKHIALYISIYVDDRRKH